MIRKCDNKKIQYLKKVVLAVGIGMCMAGISLPSFAAEQTGTVAGHPVFEQHWEEVKIEDGGCNTSELTRRGTAFAVKYDPRTIGKVANHIEDQGDYDTCWAFSSIAAIESNLIKKGYADSNINLSENHLAYFFYNRQPDPLGYTAGDSNYVIGIKDWSKNGGTIRGTALALTTWAGVINELTPEDDANGKYQPKVLSPQDCYKSDYRVLNSFFFNYDVNTVKQAVMDYGAVVTGIFMDNKYWNLTNGAYYYPSKAGNHAVTIVGWDDDYSRNNFVSSCKPTNNGAWLVKNSYGKTYNGKPLGDNGYMWVSYEDASIQELVALDAAPVSYTYNNNYQYDGSANPTRYLTFDSGTRYAQVFKVKGNQSGCNEELKAVSVDTMMTNVNYSVQIYTGLSSPSKPTSGKAMFASPQTGTFKYAGYNHIVLNKPVTLTAGEYYAIVVSLTTTNGKSAHIACDKSDNAGWIGFAASGATGQSFVCYKNKWMDLVGGVNVNLRIKAFTNNTNQKTTYQLSKKTLGISKGKTAKLSLRTNPSSVSRKVTWSSSNKKVASVSTSGKIKAKAYGNAKIKATFVAGSKKKTLTCTVTVGPSSVSNFKVKGGKGKITASWKGSSSAMGYAIYYSKNKKGSYKKLGVVAGGNKKSFTKKKLAKGTYYVKMCPYIKQNGKTLFGSDTVIKTAIVK